MILNIANMIVAKIPILNNHANIPNNIAGIKQNITDIILPKKESNSTAIIPNIIVKINDIIIIAPDKIVNLHIAGSNIDTIGSICFASSPPL